MKKMNKVMSVAACAAMVTSLTGCTSSAKYTKVGFGMVTTASAKEGYSQINTTMATVGLDSKGKIAYLDIDVAQNNTNDTENFVTKKEKKDDYGMKKASEIGKEWYEQVQYLEEKAIGMTPEEFAAIETEERNGHAEAVKAGTDLAAGVTIDVGAFKKAVAKAVENAAEVKADKIGAGEEISVKSNKVSTTVASVALDGNGKVVWSYLDCAETADGATEFKSKVEKKDDYGMKKYSGIGKEMYEQLAGYQDFLKGKTADEVKAIKADDADLATSVTVKIDAYQNALTEALTNAK